ncbi:MAG: putative Ig domain-containing protein [Planctomycetaceae bacterium]|nr:putative Ig domain-containing protein [Planctomycetaceae bacterium]
MKRREKLLALALLGIVVMPWIWQAFRGPVADQESKLRTVTEKLDKAISELDIARDSVQSMKQFKEQSLSSNSAQGALAYQQWLTDLAEIVAAFKGAEVTPERISPSRDNSYVAVRMRVTGEGTIEQLRTFLYRFHRANVLHRISSMTAEAQNNSSRPNLTIRITTESIALRDAPVKGPTLFPRTTVVSVIDEDGPPELKLESVEGFPKAAPFELRIGQNYYNVADIDEDLRLELDDDQDIEAVAEDIVELSVVHPDFKEIAISEYDTLIDMNPFAKPAPYRPRLDLIGTKSVGRGKTISLSAKISGTDATAEDVKYEVLKYEVLSDSIDGMTFEEGKLSWDPPPELAAGEYAVKVRASGGGLREPIEAEFKLKLTDVNKPPVITLPENLVATLGQEITTKLEAADPETPAKELKFALSDEAPEGAVYNAETRELTFTPPAEGEPGEVTINVTVTDAGEPAQTATAAIKVTVQDDKAQFTFMEGVVAADSVPEAWLRDKSTNTKIILHEGDDLKYAGFDAIILSIGNDFLLMQQADETIRLNVGKNLRESVVIAKLDPPKEEATTDDSANGPAAPPKAEDPESAESSSSAAVKPAVPISTEAAEPTEATEVKAATANGTTTESTEPIPVAAPAQKPATAKSEASQPPTTEPAKVADAAPAETAEESTDAPAEGSESDSEDASE